MHTLSFHLLLPRRVILLTFVNCDLRGRYCSILKILNASLRGLPDFWTFLGLVLLPLSCFHTKMTQKWSSQLQDQFLYECHASFHPSKIRANSHPHNNQYTYKSHNTCCWWIFLQKCFLLRKLIDIYLKVLMNLGIFSRFHIYTQMNYHYIQLCIRIPSKFGMVNHFKNL